QGFRRQAAGILKQPVPDGTPFREVQFQSLSESGLPPLHSGLLQAQQAALAATGFKSTLVDLGSGDGSVGLAIVAASESDGAASAAPPAASDSAGRPREASSLHPSTPAPLPGGNTKDAKEAISAARDKKRFLGGGVEYKPGQGFRLLGTVHARR